MATTTAFAEAPALPAEDSDPASSRSGATSSAALANSAGVLDAATVARPRIPPIAWKTLAIAVLAVFLVSLDGTVLFVAFPSIRRTFPGVSPESLSWILNAYTIGYGALLVPAGRLADRYGRRAFFLWGVALFTAASVLCGVAPGVGTLVAARALQSVGAAMLMPASLALVLQVFPAQRRGVAIGIWGAVGALAAAIGPAAGSAVVELASWRWAFLLNLPLGVYAVFIGARRLVESRTQERGGVPDAVGAGLLIAAFATLAYGIMAARQDLALGLAVVAAGIGLGGAFVWRSLRAASPALDLRLFRKPSFAIANAMTLVFSIAFTAMFFGNVFFLTERWQLSILEAGLWIAPGPITVIPVAILSGRIADRFGYRPLFVAGGLLFSLGALWLLHRVDMAAGFLVWLPGSLVMGAAIGMVLPSLSGAAVSQLEPSSFGVGSGVNQAVRQLGSVLGVAIVVMVLGALGKAAHFDHVYAFLGVAGLITALGGALLPARRARAQA
jgi:EmrB/QacA subfamily drug resistance transporter